MNLYAKYNTNDIFINNIYELNILEEIDYSKVKKITITNLKIDHIPSKIFNLTNLILLNMSHCAIHTISNDISKLVNLQELYLNNNKIKEIPDKIGELKMLKKIILCNNNIKRLPNNFFNLSNLEILNITSNHLVCIPDNVKHLINLKHLYLRSNKLKYISKYVDNIKDVRIFTDSYDNIDNLDYDCEYLRIEKLNKSLKNIPVTVKEIKLILPFKIDIRLPFDCKLYIDDSLVEHQNINYIK